MALGAGPFQGWSSLRGAPALGRSGLSGEQGRDFVRQGEVPLKCLSLWGQVGGGPAGTALGGPGSFAEAQKQGSRQLCSQRLTAKAAFALLTLGLGEGDVKGLEAEGPGLGHFRSLGGWDGRVVAKRGAEAWR